MKNLKRSFMIIIGLLILVSAIPTNASTVGLIEVGVIAAEVLEMTPDIIRIAIIKDGIQDWIGEMGNSDSDQWLDGAPLYE